MTLAFTNATNQRYSRFEAQALRNRRASSLLDWSVEHFELKIASNGMHSIHEDLFVSIEYFETFAIPRGIYISIYVYFASMLGVKLSTII